MAIQRLIRFFMKDTFEISISDNKASMAKVCPLPVVCFMGAQGHNCLMEYLKRLTKEALFSRGLLTQPKRLATWLELCRRIFDGVNAKIFSKLLMFKTSKFPALQGK